METLVPANPMFSQRTFTTVAGALTLLFAAGAQAWPDRPVKIVVGYSPGGIADIGARVVAEQLQKRYGQTVTVENKAGAAGRMATDNVAKAEGDGHTLLLLVGGDAVVAATDAKLPYNLTRDLQFVSTLSVYPLVLVSSPMPHTASLKAMLDTARDKPGSITFATPGRGTTQHLAGELLAERAGVTLVDVPYKGSAATMTDLLSGRVDFSISALASVRGEVLAGKLKALAVTSKERMPALPDVPAVAESFPGFEVATWMGIAAPARTPQAVIDQLSRDLNDVMAIPAVRERFAGLGADPRSSTPTEMRERVTQDIERWKQLVATRKLDLTK